MKEIGGYIELELKKRNKYVHSDLIKLNSGRNGIVYAIKAYNISEMWVPYYTCPVVWQAIEDAGCKLKYYSIDKNFLPTCSFNQYDYILYTNYFGVCSSNISLLRKKYPNLIIDNAQAFFYKPCGIASAYSPRKFIGVSDGGYVYCKKNIENAFERDFSYNRFSHLLKRTDVDSNFGYQDFNTNDDSLIHADIKTMSNLTQSILSSIDYNYVIKKRRKNFNYLNKHLSSLNELKITIKNDVPMYYPFLSKNSNLRAKLVKEKVYVPMCWKEMDNRCLPDSYEIYLQQNLLPLIIDQRYNIEDMKRIIDIIKNG